MPVIYASYYGILKEVAKENGYALALHGSISRDMDLIAVKWTSTAVEKDMLIERIVKALGVKGMESKLKGKEKAYNRTSYIVSTGEGYLDINVIGD